MKPAPGEARQAFAVKAAVAEPDAPSFEFESQKTMYGGKRVAVGDVVFVFASENHGGRGLVARGTVTAVRSIDRVPGMARQTPRVGIAVRTTARALAALGRVELKQFAEWDDGRPETELNFKFYRQATDKLVGLSTTAAAFLDSFF